jgi:hypothetical protein
MARYGHPYTDSFHLFCRGTEMKFLFFPRKCHITGKILWLEYAYKQTAMYTGPGDPVFDHRYYDKTEFLIERLKGNV